MAITTMAHGSRITAAIPRFITMTMIRIIAITADITAVTITIITAIAV
jgi:hypothetical protein